MRSREDVFMSVKMSEFFTYHFATDGTAWSNRGENFYWKWDDERFLLDVSPEFSKPWSWPTLTDAYSSYLRRLISE